MPTARIYAVGASALAVLNQFPTLEDIVASAHFEQRCADTRRVGTWATAGKHDAGRAVSHHESGRPSQSRDEQDEPVKP